MTTTKKNRPKSGTEEARAGATGNSKPNGDDYRVRRFDADRTDEHLTFDEALATRPTERQLLWVDITGEAPADDLKRLGETFGLDAATLRELKARGTLPHLGIHGDYMHVRVAAEPSERDPDETPWLDIVAGNNVVISHHDRPITFLEDIDDRIKADTTFGILGAGTFLAFILELTITTYFKAVDAIEDDVDKLDARSLRGSGDDHLLGDLVELRHRISRLRRVLTDHRELYAGLAALDIRKLADDPDSAAALEAANSRFESAIGAVEDSREVLLGSFDVYMTRTAQRTNDVMKVLALATVLLLPGSLVAGLLGMNVVVPLSKDDPMSFWFVVAGVITFGIIILVTARWRRWL